MKRVVVLIAVLSLMLSVAASAQNVILGGTFNKNAVPNDFDYWGKWGYWSNVSDSGDTHTADGTRCLKNKIQGNTTIPDTTPGMGAYQVVTLAANYSYTFSGWAMNDDGVDTVGFRIMKGDYDAGDMTMDDVIAADGAVFTWDASPATGVYVESTGTFASDSVDSYYTVFTMVAGTAGKSGKFDDISLVQGEVVPEPAGIAALCAGLVGLIGIRRRR